MRSGPTHNIYISDRLRVPAPVSCNLSRGSNSLAGYFYLYNHVPSDIRLWIKELQARSCESVDGAHGQNWSTVIGVFCQ